MREVVGSSPTVSTKKTRGKRVFLWEGLEPTHARKRAKLYDKDFWRKARLAPLRSKVKTSVESYCLYQKNTR